MERDGRRRALTAALAGLPLVVASLSVAGTAQASDRHQVAGTKPAWARAAVDKGKAADGQRLDAKVWLAGQNPAALNAYAQAVSTPGNAQYRHFLTPQAYNARFGPTKQQTDAVTKWLKGAGLTVADANSHWIHVTGELKNAKKAFGTEFHNYANDGTVNRAPEQDATVPADVASSVLTVTGLDNAKHVMKHTSTTPEPPPNYYVAQPCEKYYGQKIAKKQPKAYGKHQPYAMCGLTPKQLRGAYGATKSKLTGKGATIAVVDAYASPTMLSDANRYAKARGDKPFRKGQYREVLPPKFNYDVCSDPGGWYGEESLDVESAHGMAPDANIVYVGAADCQDTTLDEALTKIVDNHLADIVTNSYGDLGQFYTDAMIKAETSIFQQGAIEGIGFYFSTGDCGSEAPGTPCQLRYGDDPANQSKQRQTDEPVSNPWVTAVGGTSLAVSKKNGYKFEAGWNMMNTGTSKDGKKWDPKAPGTYPDGYAGGSGGGTTPFAQPFYQRGVVSSALSHTQPTGQKTADARRTIPDVAAVGDSTTGFLFGETQVLANGKVGYAESRIGGTSLSCPVTAGLMALAQQAQGSPIGFANPGIYLRAHKGLFHDVTDTPLGKKSPMAFVRANYTDPYAKKGPIVYVLRTQGNYGIPKADALPATKGYDEITGLGSLTSSYLRSWKF